ncbi:MAG TPA: VanZ family protein [Bacteroidota bacterium]|nr:VanZ family protein [Bacteroidota bacterium]
MIAWFKRSPFRRYQGPMIFWALLLFAQSSIPSSELPRWEFLSQDKLIHFLEYVFFAFTVHRAITHQERFPLLLRRAYVFTIVIVALYGASDELHQYFVPGRQASVLDWVADCAGAVVFVAVHAWRRRILARSAVS